MKRVALAGLLLLGIVGAQPTFPLAEEQKLVAFDAAAGDQFGIGTAIYEDTIVVGARSDDDAGSNSGSVYVFERLGTTWNLQQKLVASDAQAGDFFGQVVSIWGDTIVVGARLEDAGGVDAGAAYVFVRSGSTWAQQQKLTASDAASADGFGSAVAIHSDTIVVGANGDDLLRGAAYIFTRSESAWTEQQKLVASDGAGGDQFGTAVAVFADTAVIGSPQSDAMGASSGAAYVFARSGGTWAEQTKLMPDDLAAGDLFGDGLAYDGAALAIGAPQSDHGATNGGTLYVYSGSGAAWTYLEMRPANIVDGDEFGKRVSVQGGYLVSDARITNGGRIYIYSTGGALAQELAPSDVTSGDVFGFPPAIHGGTVIAGAFGHDSAADGAGAAYVFVYPGDPLEDPEEPFEPRPIEPGGMFGDSGPMWGGDKSALAAAFQIDETALELGMATVWIFIFTGIGFMVVPNKLWGSLAGAGAGFAWSIAWGLLSMWVVFFAIIVAAAGGYFMQSRRTA